MPLLATFEIVDWLILVLYFAVMIAIGALAARGQSGTQSFFLGGRAMPAWAVTLSVLATSLSAATFIGVPQLSYNGDWTYLIFNIGAILGAILVAFVFIPPLYHAGTITIYGYLDQRYGAAAAVGASTAFLVGRLLASGARLFMAGIAFSLILFDEPRTNYLIFAIVLLGAIGTIYTVCGGIKAVIWTDVLQIIVVIGAAILSIYLLLQRIPLSITELIDLLEHVHGENKLRVVDWTWTGSRPFTVWGGCAVTFLYVASFGVDQDLIQRCMTTRSTWGASGSMIVSNLLAAPVILLFLVIGSLLYVFYNMPDVMGAAAPIVGVTDSRQVYPQFLVHQLPAGLSGLAMAGMFAAAMSSFDSAVNAMAATVIGDLWTPWKRWWRPTSNHEIDPDTGLHVPRLAVLGMGVLLTGFAVVATYLQQAGGQTLVDFALGVMTFAYAGLLGVFLTALLTPRGNNASAIAALFAGAVVVLLCQPYMLPRLMGQQFTLAMPWWMVIGTTVSFLVCVAGAPGHRPAGGVD